MPPLLLSDRRRFCIRQHVLLVIPPNHAAASTEPSPRAYGYAHRDIILMPHAAPDDGVGKAAHVQQAGHGHPTPSLLDNADRRRCPPLRALRLALPGVDAERVTAQLEAAARVVLVRFCGKIARPQAAAAGGGGPHGQVCHGWCHNLFGFDVVLESGTADPVLLEINVYPAIAGGTVGLVPRGVYARLVDDTLRLLSPILDAADAALDGPSTLTAPDTPSTTAQAAEQDPGLPPLGGFADLCL